jgi:hypothetical protein
MDEKVFWKKTLLGEAFADYCIGHFIIPTCLKSVNGTWKQFKKYSEDNEDAADMKIGRLLNLQCIFCKDSIVKKPSRMAIRCLVARHHVKGSPLYLHRIAACPVSICEKCEKEKEYPFALNSNSDMLNLVLNDIDDIIREVALLNYSNNFTALQLWEQAVISFDKGHTERMKKLAKLDPKCPVCLSNKPEMFCSGCFYALYCNETCSHKDWKNHKHECKIFKTCSLFFNKKIHILDF